MTGIQRIAAERQRQIEDEGFTTEKDRNYNSDDLLRAAICYAFVSTTSDVNASRADLPYGFWPWGEQWWKPSDAIRNLEKAGALIAAEIDRRLAEDQRKANP